ncbi:TPA: RNA 3'-phosphate cyclase [Candidatus Micrarchaeota archaeon]|nr:RNA 3'-phosphate cyclase [Candidatus Micrarchaeota archaeon]
MIFMITIDGSEGEGGGQMIRTALSLSAVTGKAVELVNIRAKRDRPGLKMQHLTAAKAVRKVCRGTLEGAELESRTLAFNPGEIVGGKYDFDIGTAGSVTLVAQTLIPILLAAGKKSSITITGGTHVLKSPGYDYFANVFVPAINNMGAEVGAELLKPGYYPKGGGKIRLEVSQSRLEGTCEWPAGDRIKALIRIANLPLSIAMREKKIFLNNNIEDVRVREEEAFSPGNAVTAWQGMRGAYVPGEKGKRAEIVAREAIDTLKSETGDVDMHLADQLLLYGALAEGETAYSTSEITEHFRTNASVVSKFVDRKIQHEDGKVRIG